MPDDTKPTTEAVREGMKVFFGQHGDQNIGLEDKPKETPPETPPAKVEETVELDADGKPKVKEPAPESPAPAKQPAKAKKVAKKAPPTEPPAPTNQDTIERVASETAARTAAEMSRKPPEAPATVQLEGLDLDDEDKDRIAEMQMAGRANPKFADLSERTLKFWKTEKDYIDQWKANPENRGKTYDQSEHEEFYAKHEPQFDESEFRKTVKQAERDALKSELKNEVAGEARAEVSKLRFETRWREEAPEITTIANDTVAEMITELDPELAKLLIVDHEATITPETLAKLEEEDPVAGRVIKRQAGYLSRLIQEVERLDRYPEFYRGDPQNQLHVFLFQSAIELEERIALMPTEEQLDGKRAFIKQSDFQRKVAAIESGKGSTEEKSKALKALNDEHWMLGADDVKAAVVAKIRKHTAQKIAEDREVVAAAEKRKASTATPPQPNATVPPPGQPAATPPVTPPGTRPKPPSTSGGGGDKTSTQTPPGTGTAKIAEQIDQTFWK